VDQPEDNLDNRFIAKWLPLIVRDRWRDILEIRYAPLE
jgi:hypothetical protein